MDVEKEVKRSFIKFPDEIRDKESTKQDQFTTKTKFVYLVIRWCQYSNNGASPSVKRMREEFGVDRKTYFKALDELEKSGFIKYRKSQTSARIEVDLIEKGKTSFSMIPKSVILTRTMTNSHKVFVAMIWKMFIEKRKSSMSEVRVSVSEIVNNIVKIGFSKNYIYKYVNELSSADSGFINVFNRAKKSLTINFENIYLMLDYELEQRDSERKNRKKFIYVSPVPFEYEVDNENFQIVRNKEFDNAETKAHKKIISDIDFVNNL